MTKQDLMNAIETQIETVIEFQQDMLSCELEFSYENPFDFDPIGPDSVLDDMITQYLMVSEFDEGCDIGHEVEFYSPSGFRYELIRD